MPSGLSAKMMNISRVFDEVRDRRVVAIARRQPAEDRERLLGGEVLARMVERVDEDLGLALVRRRRCR